MHISVVIPTFNRPQLLCRAIQATLDQTHQDREIIVVDDGSHDDTRAAISCFGNTIRYVWQRNAGKSAALNLGLLHTNGDAVLVLDDDDLIPNNALALHAAALDANPTANFSYGRFVRFEGATLPDATQLTDIEFVPISDPRRLVVKLMENCFLPNPTWCVRRGAQVKAGPYNEDLRFNEDYHMLLLLARRNEGAFINEFVLYQRKHLSARGPTSEMTVVVNTVDKWLKYDALLLSKIDSEWSLDDFRPFPNSSDDTALLQKGVILFQRKVYDGANRALAAYRQSLNVRSPSVIELRIATGLLGCRYGLDDLLGTPLGTEVATRLRAGEWPIHLRLAFASQIRWRIRKAVLDRDVSLATALFSFAARAFGVTSALATKNNFGVDEWRRDHRPTIRA